MTRVVTLVSAVVILGGLSFEAATQARDTSESLLVQARAASGGERATSFRLTAHRNGQTELSSFPTELLGIWPHHYLKLVHMRTKTAATGASGQILLYEFAPRSGEAPEAPTGAERIRMEQEELASMVLLLLARADTTLRLTLTGAVDKTADGPAVTLIGSGGFSIRVAFDPAARVPVAVWRTVPLRAMSGTPLGRSAVVKTKAVGRRAVRGISVPSRLAFTQDGEVTNELIVDSLEINPPITPAEFLKYAPGAR